MKKEHKQFLQAFEGKLGDLYKSLETKKAQDVDSFMKQVHKQLNEVKEMTQEFELEADGDKSSKGLLKECNNKLRLAKQAIMEKESQLNRQLEKDLFGEDEIIDDEDGTAASLHRQNKMLQDGRRNLNQGMEHATNISSELERQKEKLQKSIHTTNEMTGDLGMSASLIGQISNIRRKNRLIYYAVVYGGCSVFAFFIVKKLMF